ncbi:MAG: GTP-binding protein [Polyangiaceae bacterium]
MKDLARAVRRGERAAVARALSLVEDRREAARADAAALFDALAEDGPPRARRFGLTGPPGAGKSSILGALLRHLRRTTSSREPSPTVAVLAIDPSSRVSGGALLGDRARIAPDPADEGVFVRSVATGDVLGGLAESVPEAVSLLAHAFDVVLVETVGVGQTESDVRDVVDVVAFVVQPGAGDSLQFSKSGVMEIPDLFVVNKSDLGAMADRAVRDLNHALHAMAAASGTPERPLVRVSALDRRGIDELARAFDAAWVDAQARGDVERRRLAGTTAWVTRRIVRDSGEATIRKEGGRSALEGKVRAALASGVPPHHAARELRASSTPTPRRP